MATSGSTNYSNNRQQIISDAFALLGYVHDDLANEDNNLARRFLNDMVKEWQADGQHIWANTEGVLFVAPYTTKYSLNGLSTGAKFANLSDTVITTISAAEALGQSTISVTSSTGMAASDVVGIVLDNGTTHWASISSVPTSTTIVINAVTTAAAAAGNNVYTFTNYVPIPRRIVDARLVTSGHVTNSSSDDISEIPIMLISRDDYFKVSQKANNGTSTHLYYDRQLTSGDIYLWPRPDNSTHYVRVTYERFLEDFDNPTDAPDFPIEWMSCLKYNLAVRLAPAFGKSQKVQADGTLGQAEVLRIKMLGWDQENTGVSFMPRFR